jgi:tRNA A37 threonylcarbamoyladenosine synthetase subunit TsaC/SUA5/YrdC
MVARFPSSAYALIRVNRKRAEKFWPEAYTYIR